MGKNNFSAENYHIARILQKTSFSGIISPSAVSETPPEVIAGNRDKTLDEFIAAADEAMYTEKQKSKAL